MPPDGMIYEEYAPAQGLASAVASYWCFTVPAAIGSEPFLHTVPPDGTVHLCWLPPGRAVVVGPRMHALRVPVEPGVAYAGVRFLPGAAKPLLGVDPRSIRDAVAPFTQPELDSTMRGVGLRGLDALLLDWARRAAWTGPDAAVAVLTRRILASDGTAPVRELVAGLRLSYRQALRRFHEASGLTPKEFARLRRLRAACLNAVQSSEPRWAGVSADAGYSDQSHLSHEFQDVFGWPPRLVHEYLRRIDHHGVTFLQDGRAVPPLQ